MLYVGIKYSMRDLICDVTRYCASICYVGVNDKILIKYLWKRKYRIDGLFI